MPTVRAKGEGTITWRRDRKRWMVAVTFPDRRVARYVRGAPPPAKAPPEARELLAELQRLRQSQVPSDRTALTLRDYLAGWLDDIRGTVAPATWRKHESIIRTGITPALGARLLRKLSVVDVRRYLAQGTLDPQTLRHHRATLRRALADAIRDGLIDRNVAALAPPPKLQHRERPTLTAEQARALIDGTAGDREGVLFHLAVTTGMREAELLGLAWQNVDLERGEIHVRSTLHRLRGEWVLDDPKTPKSRRTVPLTAGAVAALREHRRRQLEERVGSGGRYPAFGLVFTTRTGLPLYAWHVVERLHKATERLGLPSVTFHALRHSCATILFALGTPIEVIADILGHSSTRVTADLYRHRVEALSRDAADRMQGAVG